MKNAYKFHQVIVNLKSGKQWETGYYRHLHNAEYFVKHDMVHGAKFAIVGGTVYSDQPPAYID